jgi:hypothetical protein
MARVQQMLGLQRYPKNETMVCQVNGPKIACTAKPNAPNARAVAANK